MSAAIAERLAMVSSSDSPLAADERAMSRLITSADRRVAAISKVVRVRVRVLEEQVEHALAAQQRHLLHLAVADADEAAGGVEDVREDVARQAFDRQQVDAVRRCLFSCGFRL